jgi:Peptidase family M28
VTLDPVEFDFNFPATLRQLTPVQATYETGVFTGSGSGTVEGQVIPVDINLTPPRASTSGCEAADFAGIDLPDGTTGTITHNIPVVGARFGDGVALSQPGSTAFIEVVPPERRTDFNVIAELPGKNEDNVVMAGAHLDSLTSSHGLKPCDSRFTLPLPQRGHQRRSAGLRPTGSDGSPRTRQAAPAGLAG